VYKCGREAMKKRWLTVDVETAPKRRTTELGCVCGREEGGDGDALLTCERCGRHLHSACVGGVSVCPPCAAAVKTRCANTACPTFDRAAPGSAYCRPSCGLAVARARYRALERTLASAPAPAPASHADVDVDAAAAALARCLAALEEAAAAHTAFVRQVAAAAATPAPPKVVAHVAVWAQWGAMLMCTLVWLQTQMCTYRGCERPASACVTHEDWQARQASRLWLDFDRTVRSRMHIP
jgi:hypothetical protein